MFGQNELYNLVKNDTLMVSYDFRASTLSDLVICNSSEHYPPLSNTHALLNDLLLAPLIWTMEAVMQRGSKCTFVPMMFRMLSAISVGVTVPCLVSLCSISSMDSSLFRVLFWHSSQMNSRLTAWEKNPPLNWSIVYLNKLFFLCLF